MIKAIIFDLGGVIELVDFNGFFEEIASISNKSIEKVKEIENPLRKKLDLGQISLKEYFTLVKTNLKLNLTLNSYIQILEKNIKTNADLINYINLNLKQKFKLYLFSNNSDLFVNKKKRAEFKKYFVNQFYSYEIKLSKPNPQAYKFVLDDLKFKANECIFIDDKDSNLEPAKSLGMKTFKFISTKQLIK